MLITHDEDGERFAGRAEEATEPCLGHCTCSGRCDSFLGHGGDCQCAKCGAAERTEADCARGWHEPAILTDAASGLLLGHCVHCGSAASAEAA